MSGIIRKGSNKSSETQHRSSGSGSVPGGVVPGSIATERLADYTGERTVAPPIAGHGAGLGAAGSVPGMSSGPGSPEGGDGMIASPGGGSPGQEVADITTGMDHLSTNQPMHVKVMSLQFEILKVCLHVLSPCPFLSPYPSN